MPSSSSGLGHRPLKAEIMGSNPIGGILYIFKKPVEKAGFFYFVDGKTSM